MLSSTPRPSSQSPSGSRKPRNHALKRKRACRGRRCDRLLILADRREEEVCRPWADDPWEEEMDHRQDETAREEVRCFDKYDYNRNSRIGDIQCCIAAMRYAHTTFPPQSKTAWLPGNWSKERLWSHMAGIFTRRMIQMTACLVSLSARRFAVSADHFRARPRCQLRHTFPPPFKPAHHPSVLPAVHLETSAATPGKRGEQAVRHGVVDADPAENR